jgi:flagellar basal body-associated protein FliL
MEKTTCYNPKIIIVIIIIIVVVVVVVVVVLINYKINQNSPLIVQAQSM